MTRQHGTRTRYVNGPDENGGPGGCRCEPCTGAGRDYANNRVRMIAYGRWEPWVDATPAREHLLLLAQCGLSHARVGQLSGVGSSQAQRIVAGEPGKNVPPPSRVRPATAAAILAVKPDRTLIPAGRPGIDTTGARRRLQALVAVGWPLARIAAHSGVSVTTLAQVFSAATIRAGTDRDIEAAYTALRDRPPPQDSRGERAAVTRSLSRAAAAGWVPPSSWDDADIDDPNAKPHGARTQEAAA